VTQWNERGGVDTYEVSVSGYREISLEFNGPKSRGLQALPVPCSDPKHLTKGPVFGFKSYETVLLVSNSHEYSLGVQCPKAPANTGGGLLENDRRR
jgi:hypothetical protein